MNWLSKSGVHSQQTIACNKRTSINLRICIQQCIEPDCTFASKSKDTDLDHKWSNSNTHIRLSSIYKHISLWIHWFWSSLSSVWNRRSDLHPTFPFSVFVFIASYSSIVNELLFYLDRPHKAFTHDDNNDDITNLHLLLFRSVLFRSVLFGSIFPPSQYAAYSFVFRSGGTIKQRKKREFTHCHTMSRPIVVCADSKVWQM